jgi:hypothetical protein
MGKRARLITGSRWPFRFSSMTASVTAPHSKHRQLETDWLVATSVMLMACIRPWHRGQFIVTSPSGQPQRITERSPLPSRVREHKASLLYRRANSGAAETGESLREEEGGGAKDGTVNVALTHYMLRWFRLLVKVGS